MRNTRYTGNQNDQHRRKTMLCRLISVCLIMIYIPVMAQVVTPPDPLTIEAYINDHKQQRSLLIVRSALEQGNAALHKATQGAASEYHAVNVELDKYTRAFDIIDLVYTTVATGFNVSHTVSMVSQDIGKYRTMLQDFNERIVRRGRIETADTLLLTTSAQAIDQIAEECQKLYQTVLTLGAYATGQVSCTTADLMLMMTQINMSLDRIRTVMHAAWFKTWTYIRARTTYWKRELYRSKTLQEIGQEAYGRWRGAAVLGY